MKYRHSYHAGNFADVHKHVALLALLAALKRKDKGFLYLETHAGRGAYSVPSGVGDGGAHESEAGIQRIAKATFQAEELQSYIDKVAAFRKTCGDTRAYPGSPLLASTELRPQDRGIAVDILPPEARALELALGAHTSIRVERGDGFDRVRAHLPPKERRGLTFMDPPYEDTRQDFERVTATTVEALKRFASGVVCVWYPIKDDRDIAPWKAAFARATNREGLFSELWVHPRDSRVGLNGSGLAIVNPPFQFAERADVWMWELHQRLDATRKGGAGNERFKPTAAADAAR
jgi:23S rRNA (adenine2030-N6)-methyltransferase